MSIRRRPKNKSEGLYFDLLEKGGWKTTKRGYPDFFCYRENEDGEAEFMLVEVKPKRSYRLKFMQLKVMKMLASKGVPCYRWSPDSGFTKITHSSKRA